MFTHVHQRFGNSFKAWKFSVRNLSFLENLKLSEKPFQETYQSVTAFLKTGRLRSEVNLSGAT
jgi:hypothetical protein